MFITIIFAIMFAVVGIITLAGMAKAATAPQQSIITVETVHDHNTTVITNTHWCRQCHNRVVNCQHD